MPERPALSRHLRAAVVDGEGVFLLSEHERRLLTGKVAMLLAPLLDGTRTVDEIVSELAGGASAEEVERALATLAAAGHLVEASSLPREQAAAWDALGVAADAASARVAATTVEVRAFGAAELPTGLPGLRLGSPGDVVLALTDDYLEDGLASLNADGRPWLLAKPVGLVLWVGPFFRPGVTACWECLATRLRENRMVEGYVDRRTGPAPTAAGALPATAAAGVALAAAELVRRVGDPARGDATIWTLDLLSGESARHVVQRRPQCAVCGSPRSHPAPIALVRAPRRVQTVEETLSLVEQHVSPITGVVTSLRRTELPAPVADLLHHYVAGQAWLAPSSLAGVRHALRASGVGVASTDRRARAVAICEAIERASGVLRGDEPVRRASLDELGDAAIPPEDWLLRTDRRLAGDAQIDWSPVWSLTRGSWRYLPTRALYFAAAADGYEWLAADSNGNAAGATLGDAIVSGIDELVERDATAIWWSNRLRRPRVDWASFHDPWVNAVADRLDELGRSFWVLDLTADIDIPVFCAVSRRPEAPQQILLGFGAHADASEALRHAVREMLQHLAGALDTGRAGRRHHDQRHWVDFWATATVEELSYLVPSEESPRTAADYSTQAADDVRDEVERCRRLLEARGLELLVLDLTRPEVGFPVAKAIVPGMRLERPRHAPGRLYDVPVELGWLERPRTEDELNPLARPL